MIIYDKETADKIAAYLLKIDAIKLNTDKPFVWASGLLSPIYCDNRISLSYPEIRTYIKNGLVNACKKHFGNADIIAGVATAGIPQGALVADKLNLPFVYVRSAKKSHGLTNQIEGHYSEGQNVVVIEDLVSTGKSSLAAVDALKAAGLNVLGMLSIFTYQLEAAERNFKEKKIKLISLSGYDYLIETALQIKYIRETQLHTLKQWRNNPENWR
jgi:orotate phosphoribosyltransferase